MEAMKMVFLEIDFEDIMFVPILKRIRLEVQDNTTSCVADTYAQYNEWYKMVRRLFESNQKLQVEVTNAKEMETPSEKVISGLWREFEEEQRARAEDDAKTKQKLKKIKDSMEILCEKVGAASTWNQLLFERIKLLKAQLEMEKKAREKAEEDRQEYCNRAVDAERKLKKVLNWVARIE